MDLFSMVTPAISFINPDEPVQVRRFSGYTIGAGRKQVPSYAAAVDYTAQVQDLSSADLKLIDGLNIQGTTSVIYLRGSLSAASQPDGKGGDLIMRGSSFSETWLVVKIAERWSTFTRAIICKQGS